METNRYERSIMNTSTITCKTGTTLAAIVFTIIFASATFAQSALWQASLYTPQNRRVGSIATYPWAGEKVCGCWGRIWMDGGRVMTLIPERRDNSGNTIANFTETYQGTATYRGQSITTQDGKLYIRYTEYFASPYETRPMNDQWWQYSMRQ